MAHLGFLSETRAREEMLPAVSKTEGCNWRNEHSAHVVPGLSAVNVDATEFYQLLGAMVKTKHKERLVPCCQAGRVVALQNTYTGAYLQTCGALEANKCSNLFCNIS